MGHGWRWMCRPSPPRHVVKPATGRRQDSSDREVLAGLVERVTFHNPENGFCVLRTLLRGHRDLVMVVGHAAMVAPGEWITASGEWVNNRTRLLSTDDDYRSSAGGLHSAITMAGATRKVTCECRVRGSEYSFVQPVMAASRSPRPAVLRRAEPGIAASPTMASPDDRTNTGGCTS